METLNTCSIGSVKFKYLKSTKDHKRFLSINDELIELTPSMVENFYGFANDIFADLDKGFFSSENQDKSNAFTSELINSIVKEEAQKILNNKN